MPMYVNNVSCVSMYVALYDDCGAVYVDIIRYYIASLVCQGTAFYLYCSNRPVSFISFISLHSTTDSAQNLGFDIDSHLTFSDQISSLSKSCCYHFRELWCIRPYLDFKTASIPLPHQLFSPNLITATLCTTTFQNLK